MESDPPFRETRREPTDRRSWRHTPVFVGDAAAHVENPAWIMFVTGVLPGGRVEVVTAERAEKAVGRIQSFEAINDALAEGRIIPRALPRRELAPLTEGMADALAEMKATDSESEVSA